MTLVGTRVVRKFIQCIDIEENPSPGSKNINEFEPDIYTST